jgi:hypothetical protein
VDYKPGEESQKLGVRPKHDSDHYCSEKLRSLAIYDACINDKTGLNGVDRFSFKENIEIFKNMTGRINYLFSAPKSAYSQIISKKPFGPNDLAEQIFKQNEIKSTNKTVTTNIDWPDDDSIKQYKDIGNAKANDIDTGIVTRKFGKILSDLLGVLDPDKQNPEITGLKSKIDEKINVSTKTFNPDGKLIKRVISSTLQPNEINLLKKVILDGDFSGKLKSLNSPQAKPASDVIDIFIAAQGPITEKGPVNNLLFGLLNVGHRTELGSEKLKEIQEFADKNHVNIDPCMKTKGNPYYPINCAAETGDIDNEQYNRLKDLLDLRLGKKEGQEKISDEEYRKQVLEVYPDAEDFGIIQKKEQK